MANPGGWRQRGQKSTPTGPGPGTGKVGASTGGGKRDWQKQTMSSAGPRKPLSRGSKLFAALLLLGVLGGGVYLVIEWLRPPKPVAFVLLGASYADNLAIPQNLAGWTGLVDLSKLTDQELFSRSGKPSLAFGPHELKGESAFEKEWPKFSRSIRPETVVFFLALHGGVDRGEPYFAIDDDRGREKLPLKTLLKNLGGPDLATKKMLLVIEPAQVAANWPTGMLQNDFVKRLRDIEKELPPNLLVLCASDVDQTSWTSPEWRQTIFGHYVVEGMQGAADADGSGRVTVSELAQYVKNKVQAWAQANRGAEQTPILLGSRDRAETYEIAQIADSYRERAVDDAPGKTFDYSPKLDEQWRAWQALAVMTPHPAVYAPQLWRRYQEMLVRYEQTVCFGAANDKADEIAGKLAALKKQIESQGQFEQGSSVLSWALPMPDVLGMPPKQSIEEIDTRLKSLWNAPTGDRNEIATELVAWSRKQDDANPHLFRVQLYRRWLALLLSPLVQDADLIAPAGEGKSKAQTILETLEAKIGPPRPAEVHYLTMLLEGATRTPPPPGNLVRKAIELRASAERTSLAVPPVKDAGEAPYSEIVLPWIGTKVARADAFRRPGEDRIFGSDVETWTQAGKLLGQAEVAYDGVRIETNVYRTALKTRDQGLAELPFLAAWCAAQRYTTAKDRESLIATRIAGVQTLSEKLRDLKVALDAPAPEVASLVRLTNDAAAEHEKLRTAVAAEAGEYAEQKDLHLHWHVREAFLSTPLVPALASEDALGLRKKLVIANRRTSAKLHAGGTDKALAIDDRGGKVAEEGARRNRLMAIAAYKPFWPAEVIAVEGESAAKVGETLGDVFFRAPETLNKALADSLKEPDLKKAAASLVEGEHQNRGVPGAVVRYLAADPFPIAEAARRYRLYDLLLMQTRRTLLDHWYAEPTSTVRTYYEPASRAYLKVAQSLAEAAADGEDLKKLRRTALTKLSESVREVGLDVDPSSTTYLTSEKEFPLVWTIKAPRESYLEVNAGDLAKVPPGVAMVSRELALPRVWADDPKPGQREPIELFSGETDTFVRRYRLAKTETKNDPSEKVRATYHVLFRGQRLATTTEISPQPPDLIVHRFPPPKKAGISVRMDPALTYGAIAIVLDISGSMFWQGYEIEGRKRIDHAIDALKATLNRIPDNTYVSLTAFITRRRPAKGDPVPEVVELIEASQWSKDRTQPALTRIRDLVKEGQGPDVGGPTPLAYTMVQAVGKGFPAANVGFQGPKLMLVLTDGDDNWTGRMVMLENKLAGIAIAPWPDPEKEAEKYAAELRRYVKNAFIGMDVEADIVCLYDQATQQEEVKKARLQFKRLVENDLVPTGRFIELPKPAKLAEELENAIRPRLEALRGGIPLSSIAEGGIPAALPDKTEIDYKFLDPGLYDVRVVRSDIRELKLESGDLIDIILRRDPRNPRKTTYDRWPIATRYADQVKAFGGSQHGRGRGDLFERFGAIFEHTLNPQTNQLRELVSLEETQRGGRIQQTVPKFVWIETKARAAVQPPLVRWYREYGYSGPTYRIRAEDWPVTKTSPAASDLKIWWTEQVEDQEWARQLERSVKKKGSDTVRIGEQFAEIESVSLEEVDVVAESTGKVGKNLTPKMCLVVRVRHAPGKPVFVQLGSPHKGEEHRFYSSANKMTAIFWDLADPDQDRHSLNVLFLDAFKKQQEPLAFQTPGRSLSFPEPRFIPDR